MGKIILLFLVLSVFWTNCSTAEKTNAVDQIKTKELLVLHAGSLSVPFKKIAAAFEKENSGVKVLLESHGSRTCARLISDTRKPADVMASADTAVIKNLLIPEHADFAIDFVTNEMVLMYNQKSRYASEITAENWFDILLRPEVQYGHSDPNADPCGYRTVLTWKLAELYYRKPGLYNNLKLKMPERNIRPKETDLLAFLEAGELDYIFIYRSIARQHQGRYLELPPQINLKTKEFSDFYTKATCQITGKEPGTWINKKGAAMVYGITLIKNGPHRDLAIRFIRFVVGAKGLKIMEECGQPRISPLGIFNRPLLPDGLKELFAGEAKTEL